MNDDLVQRLVWLSREMGREDRRLAILGEGNTSADAGDGTFWVKASGCNLAGLTPEGLTRVRFAPVLDALEDASMDDRGVREVLVQSQLSAQARLPSVETFMHAVCLSEPGVSWVGHCHPVSVLSVLCSVQGSAPFLRHIFPDGIVVCGRHVAVVPYVDPGLELARSVRRELHRFRETHGAPPRVVLLANHGAVALAPTEREVLNILLMLDKWARVLTATFAAGGPQFLPDSGSERIDTRPDEHYRRAQIAASGGKSV